MDDRVLGDMPAEGSESGRRFGIYTENCQDLKMRGVSRSVMVLATACAAVLAFCILYPVLQYTSKDNKREVLLPYSKPTNKTLLVQNNTSSNCSTQVFSFGNDCTEQFVVSATTEDETASQATHSELTTQGLRRLDGSSFVFNRENSSYIINSLNESTDLRFQRTGRSRRPVVSTPYPYYRLPIPKSSDTLSEVKGTISQEANIFAIPYDLSNFKLPKSPSSKINFTPPPYVFTPYPNFTDSYAQLSPYKVPQNNSNLYEVMKYLSSKDASDRLFSEDTPKNTSRAKNTVMRVSGTYVMPLDKRRPGEIILASGSDNVSEVKPFFNGHAYISDPFTKYRPTNPLDINKLIPVKSSVNAGPRFRKPVSFVPSSSVAVDITQSVSAVANDHQSTGSHTVAIFHPPAVVSQRPPLLPRPSSDMSRDKPLSVTLDIYPVTVDSESGEGSSPPGGREVGRLVPKWRPRTTERPRWQPQPPQRPTTTSTENHMVVHLNLFPNNRKPYSFTRRNRAETTKDLKYAEFSSGTLVPQNTTGGLTDNETNADNERKFTPSFLNSSIKNQSKTNETPEVSALEWSNKSGKELTTISGAFLQEENNKTNNEVIGNGGNKTRDSLVESQPNTSPLQEFSIEETFERLLENKNNNTENHIHSSIA